MELVCVIYDLFSPTLVWSNGKNNIFFVKKRSPRYIGQINYVVNRINYSRDCIGRGLRMLIGFRFDFPRNKRRKRIERTSHSPPASECDLGEDQDDAEAERKSHHKRHFPEKVFEMELFKSTFSKKIIKMKHNTKSMQK
jgi:hypothetical protein